MKQIDTGGPASEKTLLDWFAGEALAETLHWGSAVNYDKAASAAYCASRAMIAEKRRLEKDDA